MTEENPESVFSESDFDSPLPEPESEAKTAFADINVLCTLAKKFAADIEKAEAALSDAKVRHKMIVEDQLPKLMGEMGVKSFVSADGTKIEIVQHLENSIPAARKKEAIAWLVDNQHADVVKTEVGVTFPIKERDAARDLMTKLASTYGGQVGIAEWVEPATLKAVLRRRLDAGQVVPMDLFGARACDLAKFIEPKRPKDVL